MFSRGMIVGGGECAVIAGFQGLFVNYTPRLALASHSHESN